MPSPFHGIDLTSNALRSFQRALDVTGHNIANVNTPGYTRQTVQFADTEPSLFYQGGVYSLGNGVRISSIDRIRDNFLAQRSLGAASDTGKFSTMANSMSNIQTLFAEPGGSGISDAMDKFFGAWSSLSADPTEPSAKMQVQQAGSTLASRVQNTYMSLKDQLQNTSDTITSTLKQVSDLSKQIADLNGQIRQKQAEGATPNDLMDQRDQALQTLGGIVNVTTYPQTDGSVNVFMGNLTLVDSAGAVATPMTYNTATNQISDSTGTYDVGSGSLRGLFESAEQIKTYQGNLDTLANTLRTTVNSIHMTGTNSLGNTGVKFFNDVTPPATQTGAIDFALDPAVAANPQAIATSATGAAGDGGLALSISQLQDQPNAALGNVTFARYFANVVSDVGSQTNYWQNQSTTQQAVTDQINQQIQSVSGVSLDDEMSNMLKFQRSYQAAAKALSIFDQVTQDLINMVQP